MSLNHKITIAFSDDDLATLNKAAEKSGLPVSTYIRFILKPILEETKKTSDEASTK